MVFDWKEQPLVWAVPAFIAVYFIWFQYVKPFVRRHVVLPVRRQTWRFTSRLTAHVVAPMYSVLPGVMISLPPHRGLADLCVSRWARAFLKGLPARALLLVGLVLAVRYEGVIRREWARKEQTAAPPTLDPLEALIRGSVKALQWVIFVLPSKLTGPVGRIWEHPTEAVGLLLAPVLTALLGWAALMLLPGLLVLVGLQPLHAQADERSIDGESETRNWPVVLLMLSAIKCGRDVAQLRQQGPLDLPPLSVRRTERVIRRAWKTRHGKVRHHQRQELKTHAARVVSALRMAEARQYEDREEALRTMATLLATIAHRYAEGRTLQLLDEHQLSGAEPVADRSWLRLTVSGILITGVLVVLSWADLPETATGPVVALTITAVIAGIYRGRLPGYHDLLDIIRGADRR